MKHLPTFALLFAALGWASSVFADTVVLTAGATSTSGTGRLTGEILDFTGEQLRLRRVDGGESLVPADKVESIETDWPPEFSEGERLLAKGDYAAAIDKFRAAASQEKGREWALRRILSRWVRAYAGLGQFDQAGGMFLLILEYDPTTQYFDVIPLSWKPHQPSPQLETKANEWIAASGENDTVREAAQLLGASWLLSTGKRGAATTVLKRLAASSDPRVAGLAKAQLWRTEIVTATTEDVAKWRATIDDMPSSLRAGAYFTVGRVLSRLGENEQAALAMMRVPILFADDRPLAASALNAAAAELTKLGRRDEALVLYRETISNFAETESAVEARARINDLGSN